MKINKVIIFIICFFSFLNGVNAQISTENVGIKIVEDEVLKYDVEEMKVGLGQITLNGWARKEAKNDGDHNIGGENLKIYIAAVSYSNYDSRDKLTEGAEGFKKNIEEIKTRIINRETSINSDYEYLVKETSSYSKYSDFDISENKLFGTLCAKNCSGKCCECPASDSNCKLTKKATCDVSDSNSACESYNTNFSISFGINDLIYSFTKNAFEKDIKVEFLIFIKHAPVKVNSFETFKNKYSYNMTSTENVYVRKLAVAPQNCINCDLLEDVFGLELKLADKFKIQGSLYLVTDIVNKDSNSPGDKCNESLNESEKRCTSNRNHFKNGATYQIDGTRKESCATGGIMNYTTGECTINMYKLKVDEILTKKGTCGSTNECTTDNNNNSQLCNGYDCKLYSPGEKASYWAWSTWGTVVGDTVLTISKADQPSNICGNEQINYDCQKGNNEFNGCNIYSIATVKDETRNLNYTEVTDKKGEIIVYKEYKFNENIEITPKYNNSEKNNDEEIEVKKGRYFNFEFELDDQIKIEPTGKYFYAIKYVSYVGGEAKLSDEVYVNEAVAKMLLNNNNIKFENLEFSNIKENLKVPSTIEYKNIFDSNENITHNDIYNMKSVEVRSEPVENIINKKITISIKNACINKKTANVTYNKDSCDTDNEIQGENNSYFVPFDFLSPANKPTLTFNLNKLNGFESVKYEFCNFKVDDLNYKYRVIDLADPFPNYRGSVAKNWILYQDDYKNNKGFLLERKKSEYLIDLDAINIDEIRNYNKKYKLDNRYLYINADIKLDGSSDFINKYKKEDGVVRVSSHSTLGVTAKEEK